MIVEQRPKHSQQRQAGDSEQGERDSGRQRPVNWRDANLDPGERGTERSQMPRIHPHQVLPRQAAVRCTLQVEVVIESEE